MRELSRRDARSDAGRRRPRRQFLGWSADRSTSSSLTNERDPKAFDLYRYAVKDYAAHTGVPQRRGLGIAAVSPDGRYVALVKPRTSADSDMYLLDTRSRKPTPRAHHQA